MKYYSFNWATGEYIGAEEADPNPLVPGEFLIPAYATAKEPLEVDPDERAIFDREKDEWIKEKLPPPEPIEFMTRLDELQHYKLLGDETIGDLFDGK